MSVQHCQLGGQTLTHFYQQGGRIVTVNASFEVGLIGVRLTERQTAVWHASYLTDYKTVSVTSTNQRPIMTVVRFSQIKTVNWEVKL